MEVKQTQNRSERRDQLAVFCGHGQTEGTTLWQSRRREWTKIPPEAQLQGVQPVQHPCSSVIILKFLIIPSLNRTVSEVHWDNQACACTEETGAIWASATPCHPFTGGVQKPGSTEIWWAYDTRELIFHQDSEWVLSQRVTSTTEQAAAPPALRGVLSIQTGAWFEHRGNSGDLQHTRSRDTVDPFSLVLPPCISPRLILEMMT